jgi:hypothetical protein
LELTVGQPVLTVVFHETIKAINTVLLPKYLCMVDKGFGGRQYQKTTLASNPKRDYGNPQRVRNPSTTFLRDSRWKLPNIQPYL